MTTYTEQRNNFSNYLRDIGRLDLLTREQELEIARRWQDPAFPAAFPHFGTPTYWENETRDLEEHVERLLRGAGAVPGRARPEGRSEAPEDELTNEDFFWDL